MNIENEGLTKSNLRTIKALRKIQAKHPDWTFEQLYEELIMERVYWSFLKYVQKQRLKNKYSIETYLPKFFEMRAKKNKGDKWQKARHI